MTRDTKKPHKLGPALMPPTPFSTVKPARPDDFQDLAYLLNSMREEIDDGEVDQDLLVDLVRTLVHRQFGIAFIVRGMTGIEGSIGLLLERPRLTRRYRLRSVWNVVIPAARGTTGHAKSLIAAATAFSDRVGRELYLETWCPPERAEYVSPQGAVIACHKCGRRLNEFIEKSPKARLCSRYLDSTGRIFAYIPSGSASAD